MYIDKCIGGIIIIVEMIDLIDDIIFKFFSEVRVISISHEVVKVGCRCISFLEDACLFDLVEVFVDDPFYFLIEGWVVGG